MNKPLTLLNGLTPAQFLTAYWQKKPLLIRQAIPDFTGFLTPEELAGLACEEEIESRIIQQTSGQWLVNNGPFIEDDFLSLPDKDWTLLVQSVNHHLPEAAALLKKFNFIPHARLDDLMISYAAEGGTVGPHFDSYDVFLLQGSGKRTWKISSQQNFTLDGHAPIQVITDFSCEQEWTLEAGDMLYLPPHIAHYGIADDDDCMTYSIGFRAPKTQELIHEFLHYLQDNTSVEGMYSDPDLTWQSHPAEINQAMIDQTATMLQSITWDKDQVSDFIGRYLTEPKPHVVFSPPDQISLETFSQQLTKQPLALDLRSQMLFYQQQFYLNGELLSTTNAINDYMQSLADNRFLDTVALNHHEQLTLANTLYEAYIAGYITFA